MKLLAVVILSLATQACTAQQQTPVGIALDLYIGCMVGSTQAIHPFPTNPAEIEVLANNLDINCTNWTYIWLPPLMPKSRPGLYAHELARFNEHKNALLAQYKRDMKERRQ